MKHKFKLMRLWVASLLLLFGVSQPSWADKIAGTMNDWSGKDMPYSVSLSANTEYQFKVVSGESWYGNNGTMNRSNCSGWSFSTDGGNCKIKTDLAGMYTFSGSKDGVTVTYPDYSRKTIYLDLSNFTDWENDKAKFVVWDGLENHELVKFSDCANEHVYKTDDAYANGTSFSFKRVDPNNMWGNPWNQVESLNLGTKNACNVSGWDAGSATTFSPTYQVSFANGGHGAAPTSECGGANYTLPSAITGVTGYTFNKWSDGNNEYAAGESVTISAATTFTATWTANQYTVTLDAKGGSDGTDEVTATYGAAMPSATMPTKTGYTFGGYYDGEDGAGTQYYTSAGASAHVWDKASDAILYAKWTEKTWTVSANYGSGGASATVTTSPAGQITGTAISAVAATGYNFSKWEVTSGSGSFGDQTSANTTFYPTANSTINATFELADVYYNFTYGLCGGMTGLGTVASTKEVGSYISGTSITLTASPITGYEVEGWYSAPTDGNKIADGTNPYTISLSDANKSIYVKFKKSTYAITYSPVPAPTGCAYTTVPSSAEFESNVTIVVTPTAGYTVSVSSDDAELSKDGNTYTFTMPAKDVAISVSASENMTTITVNANQTSWGTISGAVTSWGATTTAGVATSKTLTATAKPGYKFVTWELANCVLVTGSLTNAQITIKGDGSSTTGTATATFAEDLTSDWYVEGDAPLFPEGWSANDNTMMKHTSPNSKKVVWTLTVSESTKNVEKQFKIYNMKTGKWYGWEYGGDQWTINSKDNNVVTLCECSNIKINLPMAGDYEFSLDDITKGQPILTVKWPSVNALNSNFTGSWARTDGTVTDGVLTVNYEITQAMVDSKFDLEFEMIYDGTYYGPGIDKTEMTVNNHTDWELSPSTGHHVVLKPSVAGQYTFVFTEEGAKLDVTYPTPPTYTVTMEVDGPGTTDPATSVELNAFTGTEITATPTEHSGYHFKNWTGTDGITFADANNATTTAKATGMGTITAHFEKDTYIYFNNTIAQKWTKEPIYIYLYKGEGYWDNSMGTGAQDGGNYMGRFEMTKLPNTEIWSWHYDQLHSFQGGDKITYVAFSNSDMAGYQYFHNGQAVYKYYNDCMNMFVPDASQTPKQINNTDYYNDGFWRRYNDEHSKMYLHIWDVTAGEELDGAGYELTTKTAGNDAFNRTVKLENSHQYNIYIGSCDGKNFSRETIIKSDNCSGIQLYKYDQIDDKSRLAYLNTGAGGNYVFTLTYDKDKMTLSVEYPVTTNDYRVKIGAPARYSNIIRATEPSGTISMFLNAGINTLTYEEATNVDVDPIVWGNTKSIKVNVTNAGVYTMTLTKGETPTITNVQPYTGKYYVRTDCAQGGWNEYKTNDNNLMRYTNRQPDYEDNPATGFNYYYCRWNENAEGNVRFVIANEINPCISDTLKEDAILDNTEFLKGKANIRFSWNSNTNALNRAYISGSYDDAEYLQIRSVGNKLFKKADESEPIENARLDDNNDWTYIIDVYADGQAQAAVSAKYNNKYQFFVGTGDAETGAVTETILVIEDASKAHMQLVYDFKTDRIVTGWIPGDVIRANITLQSDAILTRVHQGQLSPIKFSGDGISVLKVQTMYGVLQLDKDIMTDGHTQDADKIYERNIYWISFPFDVRVGDIFGVDGYGEKWVMQRYNGAKRAEIGWFAETSTFWEYMEEDDIMEANVGYTLTLDPDYFDNASDAMWANSKTSVSFYFPSVTHNIDVVSNGQAESSIPAHECKIDRTFDDGTKNHKNTDSHWNVIGIPTFQDLENPALAVPSVYKWDPVTNTYSIQELKNFTLEASHAYFVQWGSEDLVTWPNASIIKPSTPSTAPYAYADAKNYMVELFFSYGDKEDHTYINLKDEAKADFVLNEDMMKVTNSGQPNIYSYAGAYDVAYNATAFENQTVNLGVIARKNGSYTFAMPKDFSGKAVLVDLESGEATDLNLSNYTVELNKGTYNNRFQLLLEVEAQSPTNMNPTKGEWSEDGKTKKLFINDNIYLINGGRIYNVLGVGE